MEIIKPYDVAIIGAGPGGYVAGIRAAQLGLTACIIERDKPGGVCLNWGCIPSKCLLHHASLFDSRKDLEGMGVSVDATSFDYAKVQKKSRQAAQRLVKGVEYLLKKNNVNFVHSTAAIKAKGTLVLEDGSEITARNIVIATGSRPINMTGFEFDEDRILSSNGILSMTTLPKSLIILGAGPIGCEFAQIMSIFGVKVTLVEMASHILPLEDVDTVAVLAQAFKKRGIEILTETRAVSLSKTDRGIDIIVASNDGTPKTLQAEKVLCVFGRTPNTQNIGLEAIGIETEQGFIPVGDYGQSKVAGVYAVGDVIRTPLLAHVASKEGEIAVEHIAGHETIRRIDSNEIPSAIYCDPQIASFGLREHQAVRDNIPFKKAVFPYRGIGKAVAIGKPDGLVKILSDPRDGSILGAHMVGHDATELIHEILLAKTSGILPSHVGKMIHAHPTISELVMEAMRSIDGVAIHV